MIQSDGIINGIYYPILDDFAIHYWLIYFEVSKGVHRNVASKRGTSFEVDLFAERLKQERGFRSHFLRIGKEPSCLNGRY